LEADSHYCVRDAEYWRAADQFLQYVPIVPASMIVAAIDKHNPRRILDMNVMFGSAIMALARANTKSAQYDGICIPAYRRALLAMAMRADGSSLANRVNLIGTQIAYYQPQRAAYNMIILEIRTRNSEELASDATPRAPADQREYLAQIITPLLTKARASMAPGAVALLIFATNNPDLPEITARAKSLGLAVRDTSIVGAHKMLTCAISA
jgi:hypothetical protein